jgi:hypothetical protein
MSHGETRGHAIEKARGDHQLPEAAEVNAHLAECLGTMVKDMIEQVESVEKLKNEPPNSN